MHESYEKKIGHPADFRVKYSIYSQEEGGRQHLPYQGIRWDFWYKHNEHLPSQVFMIWPEFEDDAGQIILDKNAPVPKVGTALMWIVNDERRLYHRARIEVGTIGYFREASKSTGICEVIEILGLGTNPTKNPR